MSCHYEIHAEVGALGKLLLVRGLRESYRFLSVAYINGSDVVRHKKTHGNQYD